MPTCLTSPSVDSPPGWMTCSVGTDVNWGCQTRHGDLGTAPDRLLRRQDSNLDHRNQNPRCCLYTTADWPPLSHAARRPTAAHPIRSDARGPRHRPSTGHGETRGTKVLITVTAAAGGATWD